MSPGASVLAEGAAPRLGAPVRGVVGAGNADVGTWDGVAGAVVAAVEPALDSGTLGDDGSKCTPPATTRWCCGPQNCTWHQTARPSRVATGWAGRSASWEAYDFAWLFDGLGEADSTIVWLERSYAGRSASLWGIGFEMWTPAVRADPQYKELRRRINLPPG